MTYVPTDQQRGIIDHDNTSAYVRACPGSGKTRTIVARIKQSNLLSDVRHGIGIISFTNSAVEEFKIKCADEEILDELRYPNFIGTFDSFLWKFIALPAIQAPSETSPQLLESWDEVYINIRGYQRINGKGISLSKFDPQSRIFQTNNLPANISAPVLQHNAAYVREAERILRAFNNKGFFSTADMRVIIGQKLNDTGFCNALGAALKHRFKEIIIDEAQDCNSTDISVLRWLFNSDIPIKVVCDPSQAIYEFRNANPNELSEFTEDLNQLPLEGNFRSTPTICELASTLRENRQPDTPLGEYREVREAIRLIPYNGQKVHPDVGLKFVQEALDMNILSTDLISLAHDRKSAMRAAGVEPQGGNSEAKRYLFAQAVASIKRSGSNKKIREYAVVSLIRTMLEAEGLLEEGVTWRECLADHEIEEREIRRRALDIVADLPGSCIDAEAENWIVKAKQNFLRNVTLSEGKTINQFFTNRNGWHLPLTNAPETNQALDYATIHEAKGGEYLGVLVSIKPGGDVIENWGNQNLEEDIRVLYVGMTRAKRLLGIAIPIARLQDVQAILDNGAIPYNLVQ